MIFSVINAILNFCSTNPLIATLTFIITVICFFISIKSFSSPTLSFKASAFRLIQNNNNSISNLKITYNNTSVENLTITNFAIWNKRYKSIRKSDIVPKNPLRFISENSNTQILEIKITTENKKSNNCILTKSENAHLLSFDFLGKRNGIVIQIIHTGLSSDIKFIGDIIDGKIKDENINYFKLLKNHPIPPAILKIMDLLATLAISFIFLLLGAISIVALTITPLSYVTFYLLFLLIMIFYFVQNIFNSS